MTKWPETYATGQFAMTTSEPSLIVRDYAERIPPQARVADLGCGAGRNALFLASLDHAVDAFDLADLGWHRGAAGVHFEQRPVESVQLGVKEYGAVLAMRLIQYLPLGEVEGLIEKSAAGLVPGGLLFLNYSVSGGVHKAGLEVDTFEHPIDDIVDLVGDSGLALLHTSDELMPQRHVNLKSGMVHAFDLVAQK